MSTLQSRIEKASEVLAVKDLSSSAIAKVLTEVLDKIGIDDSDIGVKVLEAESTTFDDFHTLFEQATLLSPNNLTLTLKNQIPIARQKYAWEVLKNNGNKKKDDNSVSASVLKELKSIGQWQDIELLEKYEKGCPIDIEEELKKRVKDRYSIIFNDDGSVDVENSLFMVRKARYQDTPPTFIVRNETKQVYRVGEYPLEVLYECPIHSNVLLVDGYCEECGKKWDTTDTNRNIFLRLIVEDEDVSDMRPYKSKTFDELKNEFPKCFLKFKDMQEEGKLPSLKRKLSRSRAGDPFRVTSHVTH